MEIDLLIALPVAVAVIVLTVNHIRKNIKDEEEYVKKLNENYPKLYKDDADR